MKCNRIKYENFRNIASAELEFSPGTNIFVGENAQGKTSALEGIYLFARGKSFRGARDAEMIKFGQEYSVVNMLCEDKSRAYEMRYAFNDRGKRICKRNGVDLKHLSELIGYFRAVLFCPAHLSIVQSGPAVRRSFMDLAISQIKPGYMVMLQRYNSILSQRNALIKNAKQTRDASFTDMLDVLSVQLADYAERISSVRAKYVVKLGDITNAFMLDMTQGKERCQLDYSGGKTREEFLRELTSNIEREIRYGATLYGVHKDDIDIRINDTEARIYASQGQQRSAALSMKLAEGELSSRMNSGEQPVYLFDDVLSELDSKRREYIVSGFSDRQVFITSCTDTGFEKLTDAKRFTVSEGVFGE